MPAKIRFLYFLPLILLFGYGLKRSLSVPASDFAAYYTGSRDILHGRYERVYDLRSLNADVLAGGHSGNFVSYAPFPPFTVMVFAPFLLLPMVAAKVLFNVVSFLLFLLTLWRCSRVFSLQPLLILLTPVVFLIPIVNNLAFGQAYLLLCCLLLEGWLAYREQRVFAASFFWGVAILFKLTPAFLFVFLLLRRRYRQAMILACVCGILLGLCVWVTGFGVWKFYITDILPKMGRGELNDSFTYIFQSAFMLLKRVFLYDGLLNPHPVYYSPWLFVATMAAFKALILTPVVILTLRGRDEFFSFGVWVLASMLISPNGSSYSLVVLVIPLWALAPVGRARLAMGLALLGVACFLAVSRWGGHAVWAQFPRLYLLLGFFLLLVTQVDRVWNGWLLVAMGLCFYCLDARRYLRSQETGSYVLDREQHLFIYDYTVKNGRLVYYFQDDKGEGEQETGIVAGALTEEGLNIRNNQIYYKGVALTSSPDWKAKPRLLDGRTIVYLSDEDRGIGFYTLRQISPNSGAVRGSSR